MTLTEKDAYGDKSKQWKKLNTQSSCDTSLTLERKSSEQEKNKIIWEKVCIKMINEIIIGQANKV